MSTPLRTVKKKLSRAEKFLEAGIKAEVAGRGDQMEAQFEREFEREFVRPLRDLVALLARGGMKLPPRELARLLRLEGIVSRATDRPTVTETAVAEAVAGRVAETGTGADAAEVRRLGDDISPALLAELLAGLDAMSPPPLFPHELRYGPEFPETTHGQVVAVLKHMYPDGRPAAGATAGPEDSAPAS